MSAKPSLLARGLPEYPLDARLGELRTAEVFLVVSLRLWNTGEVNPAAGDLRWRVGFHAAGVDLCGTLAFEQLCRMVAIASRRATQVRSLGCLTLSRDEALLLQSIGQMQLGLPAHAQGSLRELCPPAAIRFLLHPAQTLAASLGRCGLWLPRRTPMAAPEWCVAPPPSSLTVRPGRVH
jgi:hypothetical protein